MNNLSMQGLAGKSVFEQACTTGTNAIPRLNWHDRIVTQLNDFDLQLEEKIPNFTIQRKFDELGQFIEKKFAFLEPFNAWLKSNGQGEWYSQLLWFACKLPLKAARNVIQQLYFIIKGLVYGIIHPLKALNMLAIIVVLGIFDDKKVYC